MSSILMTDGFYFLFPGTTEETGFPA